MVNNKFIELYKDPRWQKRRLEVLQRSNWSCDICGDNESTLHVHHLYYERNSNPWDASDEYLITLCESCHESEHGGFDESIKKLYRSLKMYSAMSHEIDWLSAAFDNHKGSNLCHDGPTILWAISRILFDEELHESAIELSRKSTKIMFSSDEQIQKG